MTGSRRLDRQRVLVTGAAGFVGRHLVRRLAAEGAQVTPLSRARCDLTDRAAVTAAVTAARPDIVIHLAAARSKEDAAERTATTTVNTLTGSWVLEAAAATCRAAVRLGSSTEYAASAVPMDESTPLAPRGFFGASKAAGSLLFAATADQLDIRSCVLRAFQVYGPGDHPTRLVPTVIRAATDGTVLPLTGPGLRRDWVWVEDVVEACLVAATRHHLAPGAVYNLGSGVQTSNEELVRLAARAAGRPIVTRTGSHPGRGWDTTDWVADPSRAREDLDWKAEVDLADGLSRCWAAR